MQHVIAAAADAAFQQYAESLAAVSVPAGQQLDLIEASEAQARTREWRGIWLACERAL